MIKKTRNPFFLLITLFINILGCTSSQSNVSDKLETSFKDIVEIDKLNEYFQIYVSSDQKVHKFGSDIKVYFKSITDDKIVFQVGYKIRLFIVHNNSWLEIQNKNKYFGEESYLPSISNQNLGARLSTGVRPISPPDVGVEAKTMLRILVEGTLLPDNTPVGSFVDIYIEQ